MAASTVLALAPSFEMAASTVLDPARSFEDFMTTTTGATATTTGRITTGATMRIIRMTTTANSYYDNGSCYVVQRRVHTAHGWRKQPRQVCG